MPEPIDLSLLPPPEVIESLDYERILDARKARFLSMYPEEERAQMAARLEIESEPILIVLQEVSYADFIIRARINDAARSNLIAFAERGDLDHRGAFYGVTRLPGELDSRFRRRIGIQIAAIAGNGTAERYISVAMAAHGAVIDAAVHSRQAGSVDVALWIADIDEAALPANADQAAANAAHRQAVLKTVEAALAAKHMSGVPVSVYEAMPHPVNVTATIVREASAPVTLADDLAARLPVRLAAHAQLGRNVSRSALISWLHVSGVSRAELITPTDDIMIPDDGYAAPGDITITDGGLAW